MRLLLSCALALVLVPPAEAARWSLTALPGGAVGTASWQSADVRVAMPGKAWLRHPSGAIERAAPVADRLAFAAGGAVVGDDGTVLATAAAGEPAVATAGGLAVYATGDRLAARAGSAAGWSGEETVAPATADVTYGAVAAAAAGGRVCVAFLRHDAALRATETWLTCRVAGVWRPPARVSETGHDTASPAVAVDPSGRAFALWRDADADRLEYLVVAPDGSAPAPTAFANHGRSVTAISTGLGAFELLYAAGRRGSPVTVSRRTLIRGRLGGKVRLGKGVAADVVGIGVNSSGRHAYAWRASAAPGGPLGLFVRAGHGTARLTGGTIAAGVPVLNVAGDVAVPFLRQGRAGVLVHRAPLRARLVRPPAKVVGGATVRLRLRFTGALTAPRIRSTCGAKVAAKTATAAALLVEVPQRHDLRCVFRIGERGSSARVSLTIRALAAGRSGGRRRGPVGARRVHAGSDGAGLRAGGRTGHVRGA